MIPVPSDVRIWIALCRTDMRKGMRGLTLQVQQTLKRDPHAGDIYVFRGRAGNHTIFNIQFASRGDRLPMASLLRDDRSGVALPPRQASQDHPYRPHAGLFAQAPNWMFDPSFCAGMTQGPPEVCIEIRRRFPWLRHVFADGGYAGQKLRDAIACHGDWTIEIIKRSDAAKGFGILPRRWVVERTFAWLGRCRRLAKDWETSLLQPHGRWSRPSACSPEEPQDTAMLEKLVNRALTC